MPLIVRRSEPLNAEPELAELASSFITPQELFYIRTHGTTPSLDAESYRLRFGGLVSSGREFSLDDLRSQFEVCTVTAVMQCAGNRRADLGRLRPVSGDQWEAGAIGNAGWTGVRLGDVLRAVGWSQNVGFHVEFVSADEVELNGERFRYAASIPMEKALSPEVLLAWEMNGSPLAREHGFPLRVVVPGYAGVRSPKWLVEINVLAAPSMGPMQQKDYKLFPPHVSEGDAESARGITINTLPLNAAICDPAADADVPTGPLAVRGYAMATGASTVERVDVSQDGGLTWHQAQLESHADSPWSWTPWQITFEVASGDHELVVRAWDSAGQTQPALPEDVWNFKGYLSASWHRVAVHAR